jgi:hypothetical protein
MDIQRRRARQYAVCTYALEYDHATDGAEGVFDQALTNGLAAIVAHEWPGEEQGRRGIRSAMQLLDVIEKCGKPMGDGTVRILRTGEPEWEQTPLDEDPMPNFTNVDVKTLRAAIAATQAMRHARDSGEESTPLTEEHLRALRDLDDHPALYALTDEQIDRAEQGLAEANQAEAARATDYWHSLGDGERARRQAIDYKAEYAWETPDSRCEVDTCPVCWTEAFVASDFDDWLDEIGIGSCVACSYRRTAEVANNEARDLEIRRLMERED